MPTVTGENAGRITIHYEETGSGTPLVLIGGLTSTLEAWDGMVPALARRHRVIRPDNRGSGRTRVEPDDGRRSMERFADDVALLLDALAIERTHLLGASMGGMIVQEFALRHPGRLRSLVIACSHHGGPQALPTPPEVAAAMVAGAAQGADAASRRAGLAVLFHPKSFETAADAIAGYDASKHEHPHSAAELAQRAAAVAAFDASERLSSIDAPTLVIHGADDRVVPAENGRRIAERIRGAEWVAVPEAGHVFFLEHPRATERAILDFLARHDG